MAETKLGSKRLDQRNWKEQNCEWPHNHAGEDELYFQETGSQSICTDHDWFLS